MVHLLKTFAAVMKYYFAYDKCSYIFSFRNQSKVSVYKAWPIRLLEVHSITLALPAP